MLSLPAPSPLALLTRVLGLVAVLGGCSATPRERPPPQASLEAPAPPLESSMPAAGAETSPEAAPVDPTAPDGPIEIRAGDVLFQSNSYEILPAGEEVLGLLLKDLAARPEITKLRIENHTDSKGASAHNLALSEGRALAIARWLVKRGIDCKRLLPIGFGETRPIIDENPAPGRDRSRRSEFWIVEWNGRPLDKQNPAMGRPPAGEPCDAGL